MRNGDKAILTMQKTLCVGDAIDGKEYGCTVLQYEEKKECFQLLLHSAKLTDISLDAIYECRIQSAEGTVCCSGRVKERYCSTAGYVMCFQIKNGFYKINIKSVDKQMA